MRAVLAAVSALCWMALLPLAHPAAAQCVSEGTGAARIEAGMAPTAVRPPSGRPVRIADEAVTKGQPFMLTQPDPYRPYQARPLAGTPLGPVEVAASLKARGFVDVSAVRQRGRTFLAEATGPRGERVRLVVDGASGEISGMQVIGYASPR